MPGELTQKGAERAIQAGLGQSVTAAAGMFVALATAVPTNPDTATLADWAAVEVSDPGYARQSVSWTAPAGDPTQVANAADITFGPFSGDPPAITHAFLCTVDTGTAGEVLAWWQLTTARDPAAGDQLRFLAGDLTMTLD